jgi:hypothetical protein
MPRRRGLRPGLLAAVLRSNATLAFAAERQVVRQLSRRMQMTTILLATLPLVGVALGAILQHWLSRNAEDRNQLLAFRREAYVDFLRATTKIARAKDSDAAWDARTALADA